MKSADRNCAPRQGPEGLSVARARSVIDLSPRDQDRAAEWLARHAEKQRRVRILCREFTLRGVVDYAAPAREQGDGLLGCAGCGGVIDLAGERGNEAEWSDFEEGWLCAACLGLGLAPAGREKEVLGAGAEEAESG